MKLGDINVNILQCLYRAVENLGKPAEPLFSSYGLADLFASHHERRISIARYMRLGEQAIRLTGRQDIGLLMAQECHSHHFGLTGLAAESAPTLGQALQHLISFERLYSRNSRGHCRIQQEADRTGFCFYSISPYNRFNYFVVDAVLGSWLNLLRQWGDISLNDMARAGAYIEIEFDRPSYAAQYQQWGLTVQFSGCSNTLWLPHSLCQRNNRQHNPILFRQLAQLCRQALERQMQGQTLADQVCEVIAMQLSGNTPTLESIAVVFNLEPWTLRRKLEKENTGFAQLLDKTRMTLATRYMRDTQLSIGEVAWLLGFSSAPAFQRAFKRWHQVAAGQYRQQQQS